MSVKSGNLSWRCVRGDWVEHSNCWQPNTHEAEQVAVMASPLRLMCSICGKQVHQWLLPQFYDIATLRKVTGGSQFMAFVWNCVKRWSTSSLGIYPRTEVKPACSYVYISSVFLWLKVKFMWSWSENWGISLTKLIPLEFRFGVITLFCVSFICSFDLILVISHTNFAVGGLQLNSIYLYIMHSHTALNVAVIVMESNMMCNFLLKTRPLRAVQVESVIHYDLLL